MYDGNGLSFGTFPWPPKQTNARQLLPTRDWLLLTGESAPYDTTRGKQAVFAGAFSVPNEQIPNVEPTCSSGNCKWAAYGSLALCSQLVNLTAAGNKTLLTTLMNTTAARLDSLYNSTLAMSRQFNSLASVPPFYPIVIGTLSEPTGMIEPAATELLVTDHYIGYSDTLMEKDSTTTPTQLKFLEIGFYLCTKTLVVEVKQGVPTTHELTSKAVIAKGRPFSLNYAWRPDFQSCYRNDTCNKTLGGVQVELEPPPGARDPEAYIVDVWTTLSASSVVTYTLYDAVLLDTHRGPLGSNGGGAAEGFAESLLGGFFGQDAPTPEEQMERARNVTRNMAQAMTNL